MLKRRLFTITHFNMNVEEKFKVFLKKCFRTTIDFMENSPKYWKLEHITIDSPFFLKNSYDCYEFIRHLIWRTEDRLDLVKMRTLMTFGKCSVSAETWLFPMKSFLAISYKGRMNTKSIFWHVNFYRGCLLT